MSSIIILNVLSIYTPVMLIYPSDFLHCVISVHMLRSYSNDLFLFCWIHAEACVNVNTFSITRCTSVLFVISTNDF